MPLVSQFPLLLYPAHLILRVFAQILSAQHLTVQVLYRVSPEDHICKHNARSEDVCLPAVAAGCVLQAHLWRQVEGSAHLWRSGSVLVMTYQ